MQVLLRRWEDKYYVWKEAKYIDGQFVVDDISLRETNILAVKNEERTNKVKCLNCGKLIENSPEEIEKHYAEQEANSNCLTCSRSKVYGTQEIVECSYDENGDGTYREKLIRDVKLKCGASMWEHIDINDRRAKEICVYNQCRRHGVVEFGDFFTKYPNAFDKQITVDLLNKRGYECNRNSSDFFNYDLRLRGALIACVNEAGVVDHFIVNHKGYSFCAWYSHTYDKLFISRRLNDIYGENIPSPLSETKFESVHKRIKSLYTEALK